MAELKYSIKIPGKTFLFGEYSALSGGNAVLLPTNPGFEIRFIKSEYPSVNPFHQLSPAGRFFQYHIDFFSTWHIQFVDHYHERGGFGASTAQFLGLALFRKYFEDSDVKLGELPSHEIIKSIWDEYCLINNLSVVSTGYLADLARLPSGYDLWSQALGTIIAIKRQQKTKSKISDLKRIDLFLKEEIHFDIQTTSWPFRQLDFLVVPTGFKVATHDHLSNIDCAAFANLKALSGLLVNDYTNGKQSDFFPRLEKWNQELEALGLVHSNTLSLLKSLRKIPEVLFSKGCGALGADVILLVFLRKDQSRVKTLLSDMSLKESYGSGDLWNQEIRVQLC